MSGAGARAGEEDQVIDRVSTAEPTALVEWIRQWMSRELRLDAAQIARDRTFVSYGMDSIHSMMLVGDLEERLGRRLAPTLPWDHPTPDALARHLAPEAPAAAPAADADVLDRLDDLPEDVIDRLLGERLGGARLGGAGPR
jgi:acyl carrier protein